MHSRPGALIAAVVIIFVQAFINAVAGSFAVVEVLDRLDHGRTVTGTTHLLAWGSLATAALFALSGILLLRGVDVIRLLVAVLEGFTIISGFMVLITGTFQAAVGMGIAVVVVVLLFNSQTTAWFTLTRRSARSSH